MHDIWSYDKMSLVLGCRIFSGRSAHTHSFLLSARDVEWQAYMVGGFVCNVWTTAWIAGVAIGDASL